MREIKNLWRSFVRSLTVLLVSLGLISVPVVPAHATNIDVYVPNSIVDIDFDFRITGAAIYSSSNDVRWDFLPADAPFLLTFSSSTFVSNFHSARLELDPARIVPGDYTITLRVFEDEVLTDSETVSVSVYDEELPSTITPLSGDVGPRPGDRIFASAFERYLTTDILIDPTSDPIDEYVYRITSRENDAAALLDPQPIEGYTLLTADEQELWYEELGYDIYSDPYNFSWSTFVCISEAGEIAIPNNLQLQYYALDSAFTDGEISPGLNAALAWLPNSIPFQSGTATFVGHQENTTVKGDWLRTQDSVFYGASLIQGDCSEEKVFESIPLLNGPYSSEKAKAFTVPNQLFGYSEFHGDYVTFDSAGFTIGVTGGGPRFNAALWGVTTIQPVLEPEPTLVEVPVEVVVEIPAPQAPSSAPYAGPVIMSITPEAQPGEQVVISGTGLESVSSIEVDEIEMPVEKVDGNLVFELPSNLSAGVKDITINSTSGSLLKQDALTVLVSTQRADSVHAWTKRQEDGSVKVYARNIVGAGKVQFFVNGREIAWVRAEDNTDPKLRFANEDHYLVRTVDLAEGKNALEVFVEGERVRRVAYTLR